MSSTSENTEAPDPGYLGQPLTFMIDIETQGLLYGAPILSVGIAAYVGVHQEEPIIARELYPVIHSEQKHRIDPATMAFWLDNPARAKAYSELLAKRSSEPDLLTPEALADALHEFSRAAISNHNSDILGNNPPASNYSVEWWCKGPHFDIAHLDVYLHPYVGPWKFYNVRDYRTILSELSPEGEPIRADETKSHMAEYDAVRQLSNLVEIRRRQYHIQAMADNYIRSQELAVQDLPPDDSDLLGETDVTA